MQKIIVAITSCVLFHSISFAENYQAADNVAAGKSGSTIITQQPGSQYNLEGMKSGDGQYKSSYSTKSLDHRDEKLQEQQSSQQQRFNTKANRADGAELLIIVDE